MTSFVETAPAQEERPQITPGERKSPNKKKDSGPRAIGVVQLGSNGKASIIPIAILMNGKFWDASAYKADPVPMALDSGTVYEGERSGSSLGLFTVGSALHSNNPGAAMPWLGTGVWRENGTEAVTKVFKAESAPAWIGIDDAPPRLTRDTNANKPTTPASNAPSGNAPPAPAKPSSGDEPPRLSKGSSGSDSTQQSAPSSGSSSSSAPASTQPTKPSSSSGDEPPRLNRGSSSSGSDSSASQNAPANGKPGDSKPSDSKGSDSTTAQTKSGDPSKEKAANVAASDSGANEANRPRLRRGKPAESFADEEIPGYSLPGAKPSNKGKLVEAAAANKADVQLIPAISDAGGPEPKSFAFDWIQGEEEDRRKQMVDLAKEQVRSYVQARLKNTIAVKEAHPAPGKKLVTPKLPDPILENMQMVAYDLWNSNQPVLILSAQAHMPVTPGKSSPQIDPDLQYSILLVGYPDIYHNLRKIYVAITDKYHLDMTPRLELIDAVDADGDGRGELLFRETSDMGAGWVVYRATPDKLWKLFDSLNPL